jgi:hypothetical protein
MKKLLNRLRDWFLAPFIAAIREQQVLIQLPEDDLKYLAEQISLRIRILKPIPDTLAEKTAKKASFERPKVKIRLGRNDRQFESEKCLEDKINRAPSIPKTYDALYDKANIDDIVEAVLARIKE